MGHHGPNFHLADAPDEHLRQLAAAQQDFLAGGVTTVGDAQVSRREFDMYLRLAEADQLKIRYSMYFLSHLLEEGLEIGMTGAFGNAHLSFAGFKFYADGTLGGWTAYFPDGYVGDPCRTGQLYHDPADYAALILKAHAAGLQTATHAQSPTALEMVISAIEAAQAEHPDSDARHRIEHCGLPTPEQIRRMADAGIFPVNQPQHYYNWGEGVTAAVGTPGERFNPLGEFINAGVPVTLSSDAPVAEPRPLEAIQAAVTRVTRRGHKLGPDTLKITAARRWRGTRSTVPGRWAARTTSARWPWASAPTSPCSPPTRWPWHPETIAQIQVLQTWVGGKPRSRPSPAEPANRRSPEAAMSEQALSEQAGPLPTQAPAEPGAQPTPAVELPDGVVADNVGLSVLTLLRNYGIDAVFGIPGYTQPGVLPAPQLPGHPGGDQPGMNKVPGTAPTGGRSRPGCPAS